MWHWLSKNKFGQKRISHHFFASCHGHSLADAHAASIKRSLRTDYNRSQLQRFSTTDLAVYWGPEDAVQLASVVSRCCKTMALVIPYIDRDQRSSQTLTASLTSSDSTALSTRRDSASAPSSAREH